MRCKKILLVDDSRVVLHLERLILARSGYEVITAADGLEAVQRAAAERPDLVLMDVVMPRLGGLEACRRLKAAPETRDIPVIMVTTQAQGDDMESGFVSGCADYVAKPIDGAELISKVQNCLGG